MYIPKLRAIYEKIWFISDTFHRHIESTSTYNVIKTNLEFDD